MNRIREILSHFKEKMQGDYFYTIIQSMVDTLFVVDVQCRIKTVNHALLNLLGFKEEELIGKPAGILFNKDKNFFDTLNWRKLLQEGVLRNFEMSYFTKNGQEIPLSFSGSAMRDSRGKITSVVFVNKDLSQIKGFVAELEKNRSRLEEEMHRKNARLSEIEERLKSEIRKEQELEQKVKKVDELENAKMEMEIEVASRTNELSKALTQMKGMQDRLIQGGNLVDVEKFSVGVAHEIRNPLNFIGMSVQYLLGKLKPHDSKRELLKPILEKIDKVKEITQNLVQFSRTYRLELQPVKVDRVLDKIIDLVKPRCAIQNVEIIKEYNSNLPEIMADPGKMEDVVFNLVDNAVHSMSGSGTLTIGAYYNPVNTLMVRISDTGKGIPEENRDKIFNPFFSTTGSSGLGLFIVKQIVEAHKGRVAIEKTNGEGTTFSVVLPLVLAGGTGQNKKTNYSAHMNN